MVHKKKDTAKEYFVWIKDPVTQLIGGEVVKGKGNARKKLAEYKKAMIKKYNISRGGRGYIRRYV
jgi:hypothetical protein